MAITAILIHYREQSALAKTLDSLLQLEGKLTAILIFQDKQSTLMEHRYENDQRIQFIPINDGDLGKMINDRISHLTSSHVLLLSNPYYLVSNIADTVLKFSQTKQLLGTSIAHRNSNSPLLYPVMVPRTFLQEYPLLLSSQLPFKEALLPAWLFQTNSDAWEWKERLIKYSQKNTSSNIKQKRNLLYKYQLSNNASHYPSISVMISNYNMGKYLEAAIKSCLLQTEQPEEVLVIDDGSTDHSLELLHKNWNQQKKVNVFHKQNGGKARALNKLLPHVTTDFVLELDADDWLDPDAIKVIKPYLANLPKDVSLLYGNLRKWKQLEKEGDVFYKTTAHGVAVPNFSQLEHYPFPLGPRIYRTSLLKSHGGFPVLSFADGRLYEDVSVLGRLIGNTQFCYRNFTVYNVREHKQSITKQKQATWNDFLRAWRSEEETRNDHGKGNAEKQ